MSSPLLEVKDLQVVVGEENKVLLDGLNLTVNAGETHVLMGHNGAGKSTLMSALMGDPRYTVTRGQIIFRGQDITHETADVRARAGMFLSFQTPEEIPGITLESFLRTAAGAVTGKPVKVMKFRREMAAQMEALNMDPSYADRYLNVGFSGGEKKKAEILQRHQGVPQRGQRPHHHHPQRQDPGGSAGRLRPCAGRRPHCPHRRRQPRQ